MDERLGRRLAERLGISPTGVIGVFIEAKHKGLLVAIKPMLDSLMDQAGFRIRQALYDQVLRDAGEK